MHNLVETRLQKWVKGVGVIAILICLFLGFIFSAIIPFGYTVKAKEDEKFYQYQEITKEDLTIKANWLRIGEEEVIDNYEFGYWDYDELDTNEYLNKYNLKNAEVGKDVILNNKNGEFVIILQNGHHVKAKIPIIEAVEAELGYAGDCHIGDILDISKITLTVKYKDGTEIIYNDGLFKVLETEDLVLKQGFNNFTVSYAGDKFPLSISCSEEVKK